MIVKVENVEVRGCEQKTSRKEGAPDFLVVRMEDSTGKPFEVLDRDLERKASWQRGLQGDLFARLEIGNKFTRFEVSDFAAATE